VAHRARQRWARLHHDPARRRRGGSGSSRRTSGTVELARPKGPPLLAPRPGLGSRPARRGPAGTGCDGGTSSASAGPRPGPARSPLCLLEARLRDGAQEAALVQDADPLRVTEGLAPEGLPAVPGGIHLPADPGEQPLPAARGGLPHRLRHPPAVLALHRGEQAPPVLGRLLAGLPPGEPVGGAGGEGEAGLTSAPARLAWSPHPSRGTPVLPGRSALGKYGCGISPGARSRHPPRPARPRRRRRGGQPRSRRRRSRPCPGTRAPAPPACGPGCTACPRRSG
jgi:hypothetical protein